MMPVLQVAWVLFSMISGSLYYQETAQMDTLELSMFITGTLILLAGVWLLTTSSKVKEANTEEALIPINLEDSLQLKELVIDGKQLEEEGGKEGDFVVLRRHTVNITAHGGDYLTNRLEVVVPIIEGEEIEEELKRESTSTRIQRAVTAPLSGVIW
jgi:hypothetical protein